jgi:hypothetical protein
MINFATSAHSFWTNHCRWRYVQERALFCLSSQQQPFKRLPLSTVPTEPKASRSSQRPKPCLQNRSVSPSHSLRLDASGTTFVRNGGIHLTERCPNSHNRNMHFLKTICRIFGTLYTKYVLRIKTFYIKGTMGGKYKLIFYTRLFYFYEFLLSAYLIWRNNFSRHQRETCFFIQLWEETRIFQLIWPFFQALTEKAMWYNVTLRCVRATTVAVAKQWVLHNLCVCGVCVCVCVRVRARAFVAFEIWSKMFIGLHIKYP